MKLNDLVGLTEEKKRAYIAIKAARITGEPFGHTLLTSLGGLGKTSFGRAIAGELGYYFVEREAFSLRSPDQIAELIISSNKDAYQSGKKLFLFIDEVHRLTLKMQEVFYYPMKEWKVSYQHNYVDLHPFTLVAATTRKDMLDDASFVQRFINQWEIKRYTNTEICQIIGTIFYREKISCDDYDIHGIAARCLGIPRQANNLALKVRNYVLSHDRRNVTAEDINAVFRIEHIDRIGLNDDHRRYLRELYKSDVPKGIKSLAGKLSMHEDTIVGTIEPVLLSLGFVDICRGRIITEQGRQHLEKK